MIAIKIDFPAGRWHATAWGTHVNEGVAEWPPCPWRLCRALIAAWHWKHRKDEDVLRNLIEKLASNLPMFRLPHASSAHARHYMPVVAGPKETKTKIFDTFIHVSHGESLWIQWSVDLNPAERNLLSVLLGSLSYLGRAESLVCASLVNTLPMEGIWTSPIEQSELSDAEAIRLLAPQIPNRYAEWATQESENAAPKKAKGKKKGLSIPSSIFEALQLDTIDWKKDGWNLPPGARWVEYLRPRDYLKIAPTHRRLIRREKLPTVARFGITSKVPPSITQALSLSERFHQALCKHLPDEKPSASIVGLDENRTPLTGNNHNFFLPECDMHGYVTHMTMHAPCGFEEAACRAIGRIRRVWGIEGFDIDIVLLATGHAADFANASPFFKRSKTWVSLTPYVPVRHPKSKIDPETGLITGSPEQDCWRLIKLIDPNTPSFQVSNLGTRIRHRLRDIPCLDFQRQRKTGIGKRAGSAGHALRLDFEDEVSLPFGVGYASHFGLGVFVPIELALS